MTPPPVFVGGTGRSGTTVVAELIGRHAEYQMIPIEARFHVDRNGLFDVLSAECTLETFLDRMRNEFYERTGPKGQPRGLHMLVDRDRLEECLSRFESQFYVDRFGAARGLVRGLLDPVAGAAGKRGWVEMTPGNVGISSKLRRIFPESKIVHTVRDGRDVASSVVAKQWGPRNIIDGLFWWSERLREAEAEARMSAAEIHLVRFDELIYGRRQTAMRLLANYLELEPDEAMLEFFQREMTPSSAHLGRWRRGLSDSQADEVEHLYRSLLAELRAEGVGFLPVDPEAIAEAAAKRASR